MVGVGAYTVASPVRCGPSGGLPTSCAHRRPLRRDRRSYPAPQTHATPRQFPPTHARVPQDRDPTAQRLLLVRLPPPVWGSRTMTPPPPLRGGGPGRGDLGARVRSRSWG